ncbi:MAG TPA: hypothetical protein PLG47_03175 [Candidatus Dojkabacteria bacterium]|nr:hypothetical protein [Candidatus Dojkabacteria bacterium]
MKIRINKDLKIKLLKALKAGEFDTKQFPELYLDDNCSVSIR